MIPPAPHRLLRDGAPQTLLFALTRTLLRITQDHPSLLRGLFDMILGLLQELEGHVLVVMEVGRPPGLAPATGIHGSGFIVLVNRKKWLKTTSQGGCSLAERPWPSNPLGLGRLWGWCHLFPLNVAPWFWILMAQQIWSVLEFMDPFRSGSSPVPCPETSPGGDKGTRWSLGMWEEGLGCPFVPPTLLPMPSFHGRSQEKGPPPPRV